MLSKSFNLMSVIHSNVLKLFLSSSVKVCQQTDMEYGMHRVNCNIIAVCS
jgi:hypothetical protein